MTILLHYKHCQILEKIFSCNFDLDKDKFVIKTLLKQQYINYRFITNMINFIMIWEVIVLPCFVNTIFLVHAVLLNLYSTSLKIILLEWRENLKEFSLFEEILHWIQVNSFSCLKFFWNRYMVIWENRAIKTYDPCF